MLFIVQFAPRTKGVARYLGDFLCLGSRTTGTCVCHHASCCVGRRCSYYTIVPTMISGFFISASADTLMGFIIYLSPLTVCVISGLCNLLCFGCRAILAFICTLTKRSVCRLQRDGSRIPVVGSSFNFATYTTALMFLVVQFTPRAKGVASNLGNILRLGS